MSKEKKEKKYCYKVKTNFLLTTNQIKEEKPKQAKIEEYGFSPMYSAECDLAFDGALPILGWAKSILIPYASDYAKWVKKNIEQIYKHEMKQVAESKNGEVESKWLKEIAEAGYEFDPEGNLIENEKVKEPTPAQLCVLVEEMGNTATLLFINVGGAIELYEKNVLDNCCPEEIKELLSAGVIYKKVFEEKEK